jgi:hypothetical protein
MVEAPGVSGAERTLGFGAMAIDAELVAAGLARTGRGNSNGDRQQQ